MASEIKSDKLSPSTGTSLQIGVASDTITIPTGATFTITDGLGVAGGGTGLTSFTAGDVLYATGTTTLAKLAKGTAEQVLAMNSGATAPDWGSVDLTVLPTITVAKGGTNLSSFTAGDILYATGSTTLAKLGVGSGEDTLKLNAGATAPEWVTVAAASSDFVYLGTTAVAAAATVSVDGFFTSTYKNYWIYINGIRPTTDGTYLRGQVNSGGSAVTGSNYRSTCGTFANNSGTGGVDCRGTWNSAYFEMGNDSGDTTYFRTNGWMYVPNPLGTTYDPSWMGQIYWQSNGGDTYNWHNIIGATYRATGAISGFTFLWSLGDFEAEGDFYVYGVKHT